MIITVWDYLITNATAELHTPEDSKPQRTVFTSPLTYIRISRTCVKTPNRNV